MSFHELKAAPLGLSHARRSQRRMWAYASVLVAVVSVVTAQASADLPYWMQHVPGASTLEAALYRRFDLPGVKILFPRPPKEAEAELQRVIETGAKQAELYSIKALNDEQALDFTAAEADWKAYAANAQDGVAAKLQLADYYHRRLEVREEIQTLTDAANTAPLAAERFTATAQQRSWKAYDRLVHLLADQGPDQGVPATTQAYQAWIVHYPEQTTVYAALLRFELDHKDYPAAESLIAQYRKARPDDTVFPIKATALLEYARGSQAKALAVYDTGFEPLWPADLVQSYLSLLAETHQQRAFIADAHVRLARNSDDLNAVARIFFYERQQNRPAAAQQAIDGFREGKDARKAAWSAAELYTLARLMEDAQSYPEAVRFYFALASTQGTVPTGESAAQAGSAALVRLLLAVPEQPIELGAGNLSLYRDIATLDQGPGYWNGILSLWLNGVDPASRFHDEEQKAQPYFHRTKAAELLAQLDTAFPAAPERASLHAQLIHAYVDYGETDLTIAAAKDFLTAFPKAEERTEVAGMLADAYARKQDMASEFALYDAMLAELAGATAGMPLSAAQVPSSPGEYTAPPAAQESAKPATTAAFELGGYTPTNPNISIAAVKYQQTLERYLGRLTAAKRLPQALAVLRAQLDRNPDDPQLYERLAAFLQQNNLYAQQEEVYKAAIDKFQDTGWYDKLARLYLREKKREAFADLTKQITRTFNGSGVDQFFGMAGQGGPQLYLELNLYAAQRFPHDLVFTRNLLNAYASTQTGDHAAWESLLRGHWADSDNLRAQFFEYLSRSGKLNDELAKLQQMAPDKTPEANPAATFELAELYVHQSHFEQGAPLLASLAALYPANDSIGTQAASVYRSLAYYDASGAATDRAVAIEKNLLAANPADTATLATLGDLHAEQRFGGREDLAAAAVYWRRIPTVQPGKPDGYLEAATIFWDYFQFDDALAQIAAARSRFQAPALYGYEAGAIDEGKRDMPAAIAEYASAALATTPSELASARLLQLARRHATAAAVDAATAKALVQKHDLAALTLRANILVAAHKEVELAPMLDQAVARATTVEQAEQVAALAQAHTLTPVYEHAVQREADLATDPVQRIQLQYTLAASYEAHRDIPGATRIIDAVYRANPRLLGVVRSTTDFYQRTGQPPRAIATLLEAAKAANATLSPQFTLEAATKAADAGDTAQARTLAAGLLAREPYNPQYLAVMAASYAKAGDDAGLKAFYTAKLASIQAAPFDREQRKRITVELRRGFIPALTRLRDPEGAVAQYIAILSAYPEDSGTMQEAALYALRYSRQPQLLGFLQMTVKASPRDSRFAILLAQTQTAFEDYPAAVAAYTQAIAIRKDRIDLYTARAGLEERLQRPEDAAADYQRLYTLSYRDPAWMVRLAELRARQQRPADAVKALETAYIEGHPPVAEDSFTVAAQLDRWNLLPQARTFAERGIAQAGDDLMLSSTGNGPATYARILTRLGDAATALDKLTAARQGAESHAMSAAVIAAQAEKEGIGSVTDAEWRERYTATRHAEAAQQFQRAVDAIGKTIAMYATPEQKLFYARLLDTRHQQATDFEDRQFWIAAAGNAGLKDRQADWLKQSLLEARPDDPAHGNLQPYTQLQQTRMQYADLGQTLETYAPKVSGRAARNATLTQASEAYRNAGDSASEVRLDRTLVQNGDPGARDRYFELLLRRSPAALTAVAATKYGDLADAAANYALMHATPAAAQAAIDARASNLQPLWRAATSGLLGLYFSDTSSAVDKAFQQALGDQTIGERLAATKAAGKANLTGKTWFYYAGRYGVYRTVSTTAGDAEDYLAAPLERNPDAPRGYANLARAYLEANQPDAALAEYRHALELDPDQPAVLNEMAGALWSANRHEEAIPQWREALVALLRVENKAAPPQSFWTDFEAIAANLGQHALTRELRPQIDAVLTPYLRRNADYRSSELLHALYKATATPAEGSAWILDLANSAKDPAVILTNIALYGPTSWLDPVSRGTMLTRLMEIARAQGAGADNNAVNADPTGIEVQLLNLCIDTQDYAKARTLLGQLSGTPQRSRVFDTSRIVLAVRSQQWQPLLNQWRDQPETIPAEEAVNNALQQLLQSAVDYTPNYAAIRQLQEFFFAQKQLSNTLTAPDFLSLAEARIRTGDMPDALALLHRLTLRPVDSETADATNSYINYDSAARLLESTGHLAEAKPFLATLVADVPWDEEYTLRLAQAELATGGSAKAYDLALALAKSTSAPYALRVKAAQILGRSKGAPVNDLGSAELVLVASNAPAPAAAREPYFAAARIAAANSANRAQQTALLREAIAIDPESPANGSVRLRIVVNEAEAGHDEQALAAMAALNNAPSDAGYPYRAASVASVGEAAADAEGEPEAPDDSSIAQLPPVAASADLPTRIHLADLLATIYEHIGEPVNSLAYLKLAIQLQTDSSGKAVLQRRYDQLKAAVRLEERNAIRRPHIHPALDQPDLVRPRLTALKQEAP